MSRESLARTTKEVVLSRMEEGSADLEAAKTSKTSRRSNLMRIAQMEMARITANSGIVVALCKLTKEAEVE